MSDPVRNIYKGRFVAKEKLVAAEARIAELTEENARLKAGYFAVGEVREHNGSLMVVGSLHPSIELDALPIGTKVYISVGDRE